MTIEQLSELQSVPIMELKREELANAEEIVIDPSKSQSSRVKSFLEQTGNPFAQNVGKYIVQTSYMEGAEDTLDDRMILLVRKQTTSMTI